MTKSNSFEHLVIAGAIKGPEWPVVDQSGEPIYPGVQDFGHTEPGRWVRQTTTGFRIGTVIDFQHSADTPMDLRDPTVGYEGTAFDPRFR